MAFPCPLIEKAARCFTGPHVCFETPEWAVGQVAITRKKVVIALPVLGGLRGSCQWMTE
jgi:hypothetical protein